MSKLFFLSTLLLSGIIFIYVGFMLFSKTEPFLQKYIDFIGLTKSSPTYIRLKDKKNLIEYKLTGIAALIFGLVSILFFLIRLRELIFGLPQY